MPRRMIRAVLLAVVSLAVIRCGGEPGRPAATPQPTNATLGAACAPEVRDEFVRQQSLVYWPVYCPGELPAGFRLATPDDPPNAALPGGDAAPTKGVDPLYTRLVGSDGAQLVFTQGLGVSIYERRDDSAYVGGFERPLRAAPFGDLEGDLFGKEPPAVGAFDGLGIGHMVSAAGLDADAVAEIAANMRPVDPSGLRLALFSLADTAGGWVVSQPPDPTGEDVRNPAVCQQQPDPGARTAEVVAKFERASQPGATPDAGGHGPFLQQAVVRFGDKGAARAYVDGVIALLDSCPKTWTGTDPGTGVNYALLPEMVPAYGDQVAAFRRVVRSPVQGAAADIVMVRVADAVSVLLYWQTVAADANVPPFTVWWYARVAAEKLTRLTATPTAVPSADASPTSVVRPPPPPTGIAEVDEVVRATLAGDIDTIVGMLGYTRMGCVIPAQEGSPPGCLPGEAPGTTVDAFPVVGCGGMFQRAEELPHIIRNQVRSAAAELYAVFRPSRRDADYRVVFDYAGVFERSGFTFDLKGGRITGLYPTCRTVVDETRYVSEFIVWPPPGPHVRAPRHLKEFSIAEFVPTPYNTFIVTGTFERMMHDPGGTDFFAWSVPASLSYDGREHTWNGRWQRGDVFDCAESCSVALTEGEADARIRALRPGDPVCIVGWTDDVGNVQSELVYLHAPERCPVPDGFFQRPTAACLLNPGIAGERVAMIDYPSRQVTVRDVGWSSSPSGTVMVLPAETPGSSYAYTEPTLAPSQRTLVVGANLRQADGTFRAGLWSFDLSGGEPRLIYPTDNGTTFDVDSPAYSPDGKRIAFTRVAVTWRADHGHDDRYEIWVMDADGANPRKVVDGQRPRWSDDGRYLAYDTQAVPGPSLAQAVVNADDFTPAPPVRLGPC